MAKRSLKEPKTFYLTAEASERLSVHAMKMGLDMSALVEKLINEHLNQYAIVETKKGQAIHK